MLSPIVGFPPKWERVCRECKKFIGCKIHVINNFHESKYGGTLKNLCSVKTMEKKIMDKIIAIEEERSGRHDCHDVEKKNKSSSKDVDPR